MQNKRGRVKTGEEVKKEGKGGENRRGEVGEGGGRGGGARRGAAWGRGEETKNCI